MFFCRFVETEWYFSADFVGTDCFSAGFAGTVF